MASPSASLAGSGVFEPPPQPKASAQIALQNDNKTSFLNIIALPDNLFEVSICRQHQTTRAASCTK
jgi:hypothetical protein